AKAIRSNEEQHAITRQHAQTYITAAMENLEVTQNEQHKLQTAEKRSLQFLDSLRSKDMNSRWNDVSPPHSETFHWIYDHGLERPWDSFPEWLKGKESLYWIHGKAGAGKSTLMKFLVDDPRTHDLLTSSSSDSEILIVKFFFWLSDGKKMQHSLKGFLCSIICQILSGHPDLVEIFLKGDAGLSLKRSLEDWSKEELHMLLMDTIQTVKRPLCIFIDGLDEFDPDDDPDTLLGLIEELASAPTIKLCVSSRPENYLTKRLREYKQLRLQDLTINDMRVCVIDTLNKAREKCAQAVVSDEYVEKIVRTIMEKAEGVFLWVHYALSSLVKGMRNADDFGDLLGRIEELPKGMYELYLNMWNRLNEDQDRYRQEAATYFSYQRLEEDMRPSLLELLIVLNPHMQEELVDKLKPQDPSVLDRQCKVLKTHILTRCAGLLEIIPPGTAAEAIWLASEESEVNIVLRSHNLTQIKFLHRTARDFVLGTAEGQMLFTGPQEAIDLLWFAVIRAGIATLVQKVKKFDEESVFSLLNTMHRAFAVLEDPDKTYETGHATNAKAGYEMGLCATLRRVCHFLSEPGLSEGQIGYPGFGGQDDYPNFESLAASRGHVYYLKRFVRDHKPLSPSFLGDLIVSVVEGSSSIDDHYNQLDLITFLVDEGADLHTRCTKDQQVFIPASEILCFIAKVCDVHAVKTLQRLLPYLSNPRHAYTTRLDILSDTTVDSFSMVAYTTIHKMEVCNGQLYDSQILN
ncbi:MAG: hypothetical protein Q9183_005353, partial [Haloplaca sp. 2 TL-2023]